MHVRIYANYFLLCIYSNHLTKITHFDHAKVLQLTNILKWPIKYHFCLFLSPEFSLQAEVLSRGSKSQPEAHALWVTDRLTFSLRESEEGTLLKYTTFHSEGWKSGLRNLEVSSIKVQGKEVPRDLWHTDIFSSFTKLTKLRRQHGGCFLITLCM